MANDIRMNVNMRNTISSSLIKIQRKLDALPNDAYKEFLKETPIKTGNARRNTKLVGDEIRANYPYAKRLDEGYSNQSPDGMVKPTEAFIRKRMKQILRGK